MEFCCECCLKFGWAIFHVIDLVFLISFYAEGSLFLLASTLVMSMTQSGGIGVLNEVTGKVIFGGAGNENGARKFSGHVMMYMVSK
jgi:hypothetical protein